MNKLSIVMVCAGVFCTAALSSVKAAVYQIKAGDTDATIKAGIESELKKWIGEHIGDWAQQTRGSNTAFQPDFGTHLEAGHESRVIGAPTLNLETNNLYSSGTQFDQGKSLPAVDAFLQEINLGHVSFDTKKTTNGNGWCVTATLNGGNSLPYAVYDPWAGSGIGFVEGRLQDLHIKDEKDAAKCVPCWSSGNLYKLNFVFYMDSVQYKLSTIYPVYDKDRKDSLFSATYTPSPVNSSDSDEEDDLTSTKKKYSEYYLANLKKVKKGKKVVL